MKCFNCSQEIEQAGASVCPCCSALLNATKNNFISYIGSPDSLSGYQKSYKLLLLKYVIEEYLEHNEAVVSAVISKIKAYYLNRKSRGLPSDYDVDNRIARIEDSSDYDVFAVIKSQPYKVINEKGYLFINRDIGDKLIFVFNEDITNSMSKDEWNKLSDIIDAKIRLYYERFDGDLACNTFSNEASEEDKKCVPDPITIDAIDPNTSILDIENLSVRAKNILMRSKLYTIGAVIDFAQDNDLMTLRNMGKKTCDEIMSIINSSSALQAKDSAPDSISAMFHENAYHLFVEYCARNNIKNLSDLDGFDFDALLQEPGFGVGKLDAIKKKYQSLLEMPEKVADQPQADDSKDNIQGSLLNIDRSNDKLDISYLRYVGISAKNTAKFYEKGYSKIGQLNSLTTGKLIQIFGKGNYLNELNKIKSFEEPLVCIANKLLNEQKGNREFRIYIDRANKKTLQEIADSYGLTRERVRQIESKFSRQFSPFFGALVEQHMLENNLSYILTQDVLEFFDDDEFDTVIMYTLKESTSLEYLSFADVFIRKNSAEQNTEAKLHELTVDLIGEDGIHFFDSLPLIEEMLNDSGLDFISTDAYLNYLFEINAHFYGDFVFLQRQPYAKLCLKLINKYFRDGIALYSDEDINKLREYVKTDFGMGVELPAQNRAISARLSDYLISCDRGIAKTIDNVHFEQSVIEDIKRYIDSSELKTLFFSEIFNEFEGILAFTSDITNYHGLHGILSYMYRDEYDFSRDTLTKKNSTASSLSLADRVILFIKEKARPVSRTEIKQKIGGISDMMLMTAIYNSHDLIQWDYNSFYAFDCLQITDDDKLRLHDIIEDQFSVHKGYCSDRLAFEQSKEELPEFISKNGIENATNLFYVLQNIFSGEFQFSRPHICKNGTMAQLTTKSIALYLLGEESSIRRSEFVKMAESVLWSVTTADLIFYELEKEYIRISEDMYIKAEEFLVEESAFPAIKTWIEEKLSQEGYLSMIGYDDFDGLPEVNYEWNSFLLVSIIRQYKLGYKLISPAIKDRRYNKEIVVRADLPVEALDDVVEYMLKKNGISYIDESNLLSFLVVHRLVSKVIPKELYDSGKLKYSDGYFSL